MESLATSIRRLARLIWTLHLNFADGFDAAIITAIGEKDRGVVRWLAVSGFPVHLTPDASATCTHADEAYPKTLFTDINTSIGGALAAVYSAFPNKAEINVDAIQVMNGWWCKCVIHLDVQRVVPFLK
jgi:hypothetical protein